MSTPVLTQEQAWAEVDRCAGNAFRFVYRMGLALTAAKEATPHGEWAAELKKRGISQPSASRAMRLVSEMSEAEFIEHGSQRRALEAIGEASAGSNYSRVNDSEAPADTRPAPEPAPEPAEIPFDRTETVAGTLFTAGIGVTLPTEVRPPPEPTGSRIDDRKRTPSRRHPATYNEGLFPIFADIIEEHAGDSHAIRILDPMCGEGSIHDLTEHFTPGKLRIQATDIYRWTYAREQVATADATDLPFPNGVFDVIVTSPPYANRMADSLSSDGDNRHTYADRRGTDAEPNDISGMQWGNTYRTFMATVWAEAVRVTRPGGLIVVNSKDHIRGTALAAVTEYHMLALQNLECRLAANRYLLTSGIRGIANDSARTGFEIVFAMTTPDKGHNE